MELKDRNPDRWVRVSGEWKPPQREGAVTSAKQGDSLILMDERDNPEEQWIQSDYYIELGDDE